MLLERTHVMRNLAAEKSGYFLRAAIQRLVHLEGRDRAEDVRPMAGSPRRSSWLTEERAIGSLRRKLAHGGKENNSCAPAQTSVVSENESVNGPLVSGRAIRGCWEGPAGSRASLC